MVTQRTGSRRRVVINVDHVATVRLARRGAEPDPIVAATLAMLGLGGLLMRRRRAA